MLCHPLGYKKPVSTVQCDLERCECVWVGLCLCVYVCGCVWQCQFSSAAQGEYRVCDVESHPEVTVLALLCEHQVFLW